MKINIDEAIEILTDYIKLDREIRDGDTKSDFSKFCESKNEAIESLIEYVFASRYAFKTRDATNDNTNNKQLTDKEIKQIIVCLDNETYVKDRFIDENKKEKLTVYKRELPFKLYKLLGIEYDEMIHTINIDTLEVEIEE